MRLRFSVTLTLLIATSYVPEASAARCARGIEGFAGASSTVCARSESGALFCTPTNDLGAFELIRGSVAPSSTTDCLPTTGVLQVYEVGCPNRAVAVDRNDRVLGFGGPWLDVRCDPCSMLDLSCGLGECIKGGYCDGVGCPMGVCHAPDTAISRMMCGGSTIDPNGCFDCAPSSVALTSGVDDSFSPWNGTESPSPSAGLVSWVNANYGIPGIRNYDAGHANQYFAHTFTGLAPQNGAQICAARLTTRIENNDGNDSLRLRFYDGAGNQVAPGWDDYLTNIGFPLFGTAINTIDIGTLPNGPAILAQMQNGWLDILVQDDAQVDFMTLEIDYCCPCVPHDSTVSAGVNDNFWTGNGVESPAPSANLLNYWAVNWANQTPRNFDTSGLDLWFGHTFTGLAPENGAYICAATFTAAVSSQGSNDATWLYFSNALAWYDGPFYWDYLSNLGVPVNTSGTITVNIGALPGGLAYLAQLELGSLDWVVQDDTAVDYGTLQVSYCCGDSPNPDPDLDPTPNPNPPGPGNPNPGTEPVPPWNPPNNN